MKLTCLDVNWALQNQNHLDDIILQGEPLDTALGLNSRQLFQLRESEQIYGKCRNRTAEKAEPISEKTDDGIINSVWIEKFSRVLSVHFSLPFRY